MTPPRPLPCVPSAETFNALAQAALELAANEVLRRVGAEIGALAERLREGIARRRRCER
jgi:hypothetical protein